MIDAPLDRDRVRRRADLLTGAVLGVFTLFLVSQVAGASVRSAVPLLDDPTELPTFVVVALGLAALAGLIVMGGWRGMAAMCVVITIAGLAAGGTALSPFALGGAAPALAALAAATLAGAALIRPRPEREVASDERDQGPARDRDRDRVPREDVPPR